jgi:hypothetical protein
MHSVYRIVLHCIRRDPVLRAFILLACGQSWIPDSVAGSKRSKRLRGVNTSNAVLVARYNSFIKAHVTQLSLRKLITFNDEFTAFFSELADVECIQSKNCNYDSSPGKLTLSLKDPEKRGVLVPT